MRRIEIELRTLQNLHNQLQNVMTQASLIICFSLAALSSDNLTALGNDTSRFCVYKDGLHYWTALAFLCSSCMCICLCALLVQLRFRLVIPSGLLPLARLCCGRSELLAPPGHGSQLLGCGCESSTALGCSSGSSSPLIYCDGPMLQFCGR